MRIPSASRRHSAAFILATAGFSLFALHCSSDGGTESTGTAGSSTQPTSGAGGSASQGGSSAGMTTGGVTTAGTASGGAGTAGVAGTATTAGTGGVAGSGTGGGGGGVGGSAGSAGTGGGGGSGGSGGAGVTFGQVKDLLGMSCKGSNCHDKGNGKNNIDLVTADGLYTRLTTAIPAGTSHCDGTVMVVPGNTQMSFLVTATAGPGNGKVTCKKGNGTEMIARMPDDCPGQRPCLTDAQIKLLTDWVAAGAPM